MQLLAVGLIIVTVMSAGYASVYEGPGLGSRATAQGGAFIAQADDWTAIYWNPAGLAEQQGLGIGNALEYLSVRTHDSAGLRNPVAPYTSENILRGDALAQLGGEPTSFPANDSSFGIPLPAVAVHGSWKRLGWAAGSYTPMGFAFEIKDTSTPGMAASFESQGYLINHNISLGYTVLPGLSLGAGVNGVQTRVERESHKTTPLSEFSTRSTMSGWGVQGVFGFLYDWQKRLRFGGVYRTGSDLVLKGQSRTSDSRFPLVIPGVGTLNNETSDITNRLRNPTTFGLGLSWRAMPTLTLSADWQRTQWHEARREIGFATQGFSLQNQSLDQNWSDSNRYRFGAEWRFLPRWSARLGTFRDPDVVPYSQQSLTNFVDVPCRYYTGGIGFDARSWSLHTGLQYLKGSAQVGTQTFKREALNWTTQLDFRFGAK